MLLLLPFHVHTISCLFRGVLSNNGALHQCGFTCQQGAQQHPHNSLKRHGSWETIERRRYALHQHLSAVPDYVAHPVLRLGLVGALQNTHE